MTQEQERKLNELYEFMQSLKTSTTIPLPVDESFRDRFQIANLAKLQFQTTKNASTETQAVNEGGVATYNVAKPMDGFFLLVLNNTAYYIPYHNA